MRTFCVSLRVFETVPPPVLAGAGSSSSGCKYSSLFKTHCTHASTDDLKNVHGQPRLAQAHKSERNLTFRGALAEEREKMRSSFLILVMRGPPRCVGPPWK
jgi:hypothetical protein